MTEFCLTMTEFRLTIKENRLTMTETGVTIKENRLTIKENGLAIKDLESFSFPPVVLRGQDSLLLVEAAKLRASLVSKRLRLKPWGERPPPPALS